jgi:hypothetical protein
MLVGAVATKIRTAGGRLNIRAVNGNSKVPTCGK